jgi:NAD+ kinase
MTPKKRVGIYCNLKADPPKDIIQQIVDRVTFHNGEIVLHQAIVEKLSQICPNCNVFNTPQEVAASIDVMFSIGGDGTFLGTVPLVIEGDIPVIGINIGRLGFLANVARNQITQAIDDWFTQNFTLVERSLIEVALSDKKLAIPSLCALNDVTIRRTDGANMMSFKTIVNGQFLNNYWADGLILATPTGSTAYSLSCGGPILDINATAFIITPIASHNLTVRPLVISDQSMIEISVSGRSDHFFLSIDSESYTIPITETIKLRKASQTIKTVVFKNQSFYDTIRDKLSWGMDKRN